MSIQNFESMKDEGRRTKRAVSPFRAVSFVHPSYFAFRTLHHDQSGSISLATVFALLLLTMLLGMVINVGRQVDNKIKLQNAADAATYSGGVVLARGMNSLAFSNHMLCEVFALTAFMREARDRHAEPLVPEILTAWNTIGPILARSGFDKFDRAGAAIPQKTPLEQEMVRTYSEWMAASSELLLPVLEEILAQEMIPQFQRDAVQAIPVMAQRAAASIAEQQTASRSSYNVRQGPISGVLWRTLVDPVGGSQSESSRTTLPAVDPQVELSVQAQARKQRDSFATHYLSLWNERILLWFDHWPQGEAKMSQFGQLWRGFTCAQLKQLLQEYPDRNLPHMIREAPPPPGSANAWLEQDYEFVGVAYRQKMPALMPRLFTDSLQAGNQAFAQGMLFVPRARPVDVAWYTRDGNRYWSFVYDGAPQSWDLWNQNWTFQLTPATAQSIPAILSQQPQTPFVAAGVQSQQMPNLSSVSPAAVRQVTTH